MPAPCAVDIEEPMYSWLTDPQSLTEKLTEYYQAPVIVQVLEQTCKKPSTKELIYLNQYPNQSDYIIRNVLLILKGTVRIYASSIFSNTKHPILKPYFQHFSHLPLGAWLFRQPGLTRSPFDITYTHRLNLPIEAQKISLDYIWGRRSIFSLDSTVHVAVSEFFLTACSAP